MIELYWIWAIVGLGCFILEILMGSQFVLFLLGFSAILTATVILISPNFGVFGSVILFSGLSALLLMMLWKGGLKSLAEQSHKSDVNNTLLQLHHREGEVIRSNGDKMTVLIEKNLWSAETRDKKNLPDGCAICVIGHKGMVLLIEQLPKS